MKRKLDEADVPTAVTASVAVQTDVGFSSTGLDTRLLQAVASEGFSVPTSVQSKVIPLALEGKDVHGMYTRRSLLINSLTLSK